MNNYSGDFRIHYSKQNFKLKKAVNYTYFEYRELSHIFTNQVKLKTLKKMYPFKQTNYCFVPYVIAILLFLQAVILRRFSRLVNYVKNVVKSQIYLSRYCCGLNGKAWFKYLQIYKFLRCDCPHLLEKERFYGKKVFHVKCIKKQRNPSRPITKPADP